MSVLVLGDFFSEPVESPIELRAWRHGDVAEIERLFGASGREKCGPELCEFLARFTEPSWVVIWLTSCTKEDLVWDFEDSGPFPGLTRLLRPMIEGRIGLLVMNFEFGPSDSDMDLLARCATIAAGFGVPLLANASHEWAQLGSHPLRQQDWARFVALTRPATCEGERLCPERPSVFALAERIASSFTEFRWCPVLLSRGEEQGPTYVPPTSQPSSSGIARFLENGVVPIFYRKDETPYLLVAPCLNSGEGSTESCMWHLPATLVLAQVSSYVRQHVLEWCWEDVLATDPEGLRQVIQAWLDDMTAIGPGVDTERIRADRLLRGGNKRSWVEPFSKATVAVKRVNENFLIDVEVHLNLVSHQPLRVTLDSKLFRR